MKKGISKVKINTNFIGALSTIGELCSLRVLKSKIHFHYFLPFMMLFQRHWQCHIVYGL